MLCLMIKAPKPQQGYADRGLIAPAYLTQDQEDKVWDMQPSIRKAWNWLVSRQEEALQAQEAKAIRMGLVGPKPKKPVYNGMTIQYLPCGGINRKSLFSFPRSHSIIYWFRYNTSRAGDKPQATP